MPGRSTHKYIVMASGKIGGKTHVWVAGVFTDLKQAKPWVALLNVARKANDVETVTSMDVHAPALKEGEELTGVKYTGVKVQYSPDAPGLSDDAELG